MPASGRDMWRLKPPVHFLGASMHASWHFGMFPREDFGVAYGYCCDLIRSVSAPSPWWVTELQAGPTVFTGTRPLNPTEGRSAVAVGRRRQRRARDRVLAVASAHGRQ